MYRIEFKNICKRYAPHLPMTIHNANLTIEHGEFCVFVGPSDLAADMGYPGNTAAPEVQAAIDTALHAIIASGKSAGILTFDPAAAARYRDMGVTFIGVGGDIAILVKGAAALASQVRGA